MDVASTRSEKDLVDKVWRLSSPPKELGTKATITAKMFLVSTETCTVGYSQDQKPMISPMGIFDRKWIRETI